MENLPKHIYLNIGIDDATDFNELHEITWSKDEVYKSDLKFISVDFISRRIEEITAEIKNLTDSSMATSFKLNSLRAVKKELKSLLV